MDGRLSMAEVHSAGSGIAIRAKNSEGTEGPE